jgi:hypothetical protein
MNGKQDLFWNESKKEKSSKTLNKKSWVVMHLMQRSSSLGIINMSTTHSDQTAAVDQTSVLKKNNVKYSLTICCWSLPFLLRKGTLGRGAHKSVSWVFQSFFFFQYMLLSLSLSLFSLIFKEIMET